MGVKISTDGWREQSLPYWFCSQVLFNRSKYIVMNFKCALDNVISRDRTIWNFSGPMLIFFPSALADDRYGLPIFLSQYLEPIPLLLPQFTS